MPYGQYSPNELPMMHATSILLTGVNDSYLDGLRFQLQVSGCAELVYMPNQETVPSPFLYPRRPSLIIVNIQLSCPKGWDLLQEICLQAPNMPIIAFGLFRSASDLSRVLQTGARGCLDKSCSPFEITEALQTVQKDQYYYSNRCRSLLAEHLSESGSYLSPVYSEQEKAVIRLVCEEYSNKQIASQLQLSVNSIERALMRIRGKMGVKSTNGLVLYAARHGLCNRVA
jgi:DNA-binding NarL/FixJ family response regulator